VSLLYKPRKIYYTPKICHPQKRWLSNLQNVRSLSYYIQINYMKWKIRLLKMHSL